MQTTIDSATNCIHSTAAYLFHTPHAKQKTLVLQAAGEMMNLQQRGRDSAAYQAAVAARAATGAAAANLRKRCNQCEACLTSQVSLLHPLLPLWSSSQAQQQRCMATQKEHFAFAMTVVMRQLVLGSLGWCQQIACVPRHVDAYKSIIHRCMCLGCEGAVTKVFASAGTMCLHQSVRVVKGCVSVLLNIQGNQRRCLTNRAAAAAAAGHSGAQIAILKHAAVGARISVWWPLDEHWYRYNQLG